MKNKLQPFFTLFLISLILLMHKITFAQHIAPTYPISGQIVDSISQQRMSMITIRLKNDKNEQLNALVTKGGGTFSFPALHGKSYWISITAIGYQQKVISIAGSNKGINLGIILLQPQVNSLKDVAIIAERPIIQHKPDRIIYDMQADPESKGSSVLGMLHKIPFLSLDGSDQLLLKGNSSYQVMINGKPSSMVNSKLTAILRSMPAATIQKIEVITTPPSKYDAEGLAGIINIVTNRKISDGYNGSLNLNGSGPVAGPGAGGSFTAKVGRFGISAFAGAGIFDNPQTSFQNTRISSGHSLSTLRQHGFSVSTQRNGYFGTELSYEIDSLQLISGQFNTNGNRTKGNQNITAILAEEKRAEHQYDFANQHTDHAYGTDAAINYQLGFKSTKNQFFTLSYRYSSNPGDQFMKADFSNQVNYNAPAYQQNGQQQFKEQTAQLDFTSRVKKINIETGLKAIFRKSESDFEYHALDELSIPSEPVHSFSEQYRHTQNIFSVYNAYQLALDRWNFSLGLRFEHTVMRADFLSSGAVTDQNYNHLLPSIAIGKNFKNGNSINFGWSQRIRRPGINRLNPYTDRSNPNIESTGNPNLRPVLMNSLQTGFSSNKKLSVNLSIDYSFMNNLDLKISSYDPLNEITTTTFANVGKAKSLGMNFNFAYPFTKWYHLGINGQVMYLWLSGPSDGVKIDNNRCTYFLSLSNAFIMANGWRVNANLNAISRNPNGLQGSSNGLISTEIGVNKQLIRDKLGFALGLKNPFTKYRTASNEWFGHNFQQFSSSQEYFRSFRVSLNYNFGGLKDGLKKSKNEIRNNDLSN
ncbi:TonB-dependent receptor [Pedobacter sp. N36a]|uniref:outer membrane beta-barrel family protein n=1 Tax=Pedobacter sp. N36a TaxID=2767996 RepID=UPI0016573128|nr:outer membrane beta-barrel family protein [Pedobacter sp. N36a]MBC8985379.1 TonB-dependent receptor [Pedobacter sp. N36a]